MADTTRARLFRGSLWISGARAAANVLGLISTVVLARLLVPGDFGIVALGLTFTSVIQSVTDVAVSEALVQLRDPEDAHYHTAWTITLLRAALLSGLFAAAAWPIAHAYHDPRLMTVVFMLSASAFVGGFSNPRSIMLTKQLVFWQQFMLQITQKVTTLVVSVGAAFLFHSYWALLAGALAGQVAGVLVSYTVLPFRPKVSLAKSRDLLSFSVWLTLCQLVNTINWNSDHFLIGSFLGRVQLGYYKVGNDLAVIPSREATAPLTPTLFPAFSRLSDQPERLAAAYQSSQALVTAIALPAGVGVALIADPLVRLGLGARWVPSIFVVQCLASVFAIQTLGNLAQPLAMATGRTKLLFHRDWQSFAFRVPSILIGAWLGGFAGIVYARCITGSVSVLFNSSVVTRVTGLSFLQQMRVNVRSLSATAAMALLVTAANAVLPEGTSPAVLALKIAVLSAVGAVAYLGITASLWTASGRPRGPETEVLSVAGRVLPGLRALLPKAAQPHGAG